MENLRGNVNTRLRKIGENNWNGAIFAAAGLERIHLRPENSIDLDWMLPAPARTARRSSCTSACNKIRRACQGSRAQNVTVCRYRDLAPT